VEPAKDAAKDAVKDVKDTAKDTVKDAKDTAKDAAQPVPGAARDAARDARDTVRDVRDAARDTVRDVRGSVRASANARANLRWQDMRSADLGLWFNTSANVNVNDGLVIADVATQGPIAKLGFQEGDRIISINGQRVTRQADFMQFLFTSNVARVPVIINRGGQQVTIYMEPQVFLTSVNSYQSDPLEQIGIIADDRIKDQAVVWRVMPRSPAFYGGLRSGDVIVSLNKQPVNDAAELSQLAAKAEPGPIALEVQRGDRARLLEVEFQAPSTEVRSALRPDYDSGAPALVPARGYYNNNYVPRRGLFRWRRY
jgi:membrane-associated protease RseP (regulator of RpoE activity)